MMRFIYYPSPGGPYDADAADYIARVNAVDAANGASGGLEAGLQDIIHILFRDLKLDASPFAGVSNFAALKASCLLAGPRTRQGCAVPLLASMPTPTFQGTVGGWIYNRKNGLQGNGTNNYLNTNHAGNADPQNNAHSCIYRTDTAVLGTEVFFASLQSGNVVNTSCYTFLGRTYIGLRSGAGATSVAGANVNGIIAASRQSAGAFDYFIGSSSGSSSQASNAVNNVSNFVLAANYNGSPGDFSRAVISLYSFGEASTLSALNSRISAYMAALNALTLT